VRRALFSSLILYSVPCERTSAGRSENPKMIDEYQSVCQNFRWDIPARYNLGAALCDANWRRRSDVALIVADSALNERRFSFGYLSDQSNRMANLLKERGCRPGDRVAVMLEPSVECAICLLAILKSGMLALPLNTDTPTGHIEHLEAAGARIILTSRYLAEVHGPGWSEIKTLSAIEVVQEDYDNCIGEQIDKLLSRYSCHFAVADTAAGSPAILSFTSGSEGKPKGVVQPHGIVLGTMPVLVFTKIPQPYDVVWSNFGWNWLGGLMVAFGAWHCGASVLIERKSTMTPGKIIDLLKRFHVSRVSLSPTVLKMLRSGARSAKYPSLTSITTGGEKLDVETREWVRSRFGTELCELYGLTECSGVLGSGYVVPPLPGALGKPAPGMEVQIISDDGELLGPGEHGTIAIRSPHPAMFHGYWQNEDATTAKFLGTLLKTGDLGFRDETGYFWYVSRADNLIKSGGKRIGPSEIEDAFSRDPSVMCCAAIGVPDPLAGEAIVLWVQLKSGLPHSPEIEQHLFATARAVLAPYQVPRRICFVDAIPRTANGKIHHAAVRQAELEGPR
jgi:acetyl-CoA synthetase